MMSSFATSAPQLEKFLTRSRDRFDLTTSTAGDSGNARFIVRNFLIEEHAGDERTSEYGQTFAPEAPRTFDEWNNIHNQYIDTWVYLKPPLTHDHRSVAKDNPVVCPSTFRAAEALTMRRGVDIDTDLIRIMAVADLAWLSEIDEARLYALGHHVVARPDPHSVEWKELAVTLEEAFHGRRCDRRPVFAAFYEDFLDDLRDPADTTWPDKLKNRLALHDLALRPARGPRHIFLFRYSVRDVSWFRGHADDRPLAVPTVLDSYLSESFCPTPRELHEGRALNLTADATETPAREVLHLFTPLQPTHLCRVGTITATAPYDLTSQRRDHLLWLNLLAVRTDYGSETDADLIG